MPAVSPKLDFEFVKKSMIDEGLRESSAITYISRIKTVLNKTFDKVNITPGHLRKNKKKLIQQIIDSGTSANNRKVSLMALTHLFNIYDISIDDMEKPIKQLSALADAESLNDKSAETIEKINEIDFNLMRNKIDSIEDPTNRLICACYTLVPPLRQQDWMNVPVLKTKPKENINHVNLKTKQLVIVEHKTSKIHGAKSIPLQPKLISEIKRYCSDPAHNNTLFPLSTSAMNRRITAVFGHSSGLLRKAFISKYSSTMSNEKLVELSNIMGHKISTALISYRKNVTPELQPEEPIPDSASEASETPEASE